MRKITSAEVARVAGVSQSAVSRAYTPGASVSPDTAEKVREAARQLGYRPNALARSLITGRSRIIALVVAYFENQFYPAAVELISHELKKNGYHLLVFMASNDDAETERIVADLLDYQVDGLIAASVAMTVQLASRCRAEGIPVILFNRHQGDDGLNSVTSDNVEGARRIARFLVEGGHRHIAQISGWQGSSTGSERDRGFRLGLAECGVEPVCCVDGMYRREVASEVARDMFSGTGGPVPDAVFVGNDHMAFAVMDVIRHELGLRIPEDVSVVGYDDVPIAAWPSFNLTTMRQPLGRLVEMTVSRMLETIAEPDEPPVQIRIPCDFKIRGTARLPGAGWSEGR